MKEQLKTSWESSAKWYDDVVGKEGHYYHQNVILPNLLENLKGKKIHLLDLCCGQGILSRALPKHVEYVGVDISPSLIQSAKSRAKNPKHKFLVSDATKKLPLPKAEFTDVVCILALQNIQDPLLALKNAADHLKNSGRLHLVLNHPCFRIPRQSHWGIDEPKKLQYRRIDSYLSEQKIPIQTHPGKKGVKTYSFHHSLSAYSKMLFEAGFVIEELDEWVSDKKSTGGRARMENRARKEFPLFLSLMCRKTNF